MSSYGASYFFYNAEGQVCAVQAYSFNGGAVIGSWSYTYDNLNRLRSATTSAAPIGGSSSPAYGCWSYDPFGNRQMEQFGASSCTTGAWTLSTPSTPTASNQVSGYTYDRAGNAIQDNQNSYAYDAEGRLCAVAYLGAGSEVYEQYLYDAEGRRVAKGAIATWSCDPAVSGFQLTESYVLGQGGEELTQLGPPGQNNTNWQRTNVYGAGKQLATYDTLGLHFQLTDPLGTRRMQTSAVGQPETDIQSMPFGDLLSSFPDQYAPATADDATPLHFTGKERDTESGNDYFGARYFASTMGRWLSPDKPFADQHTANPQSWNLYAYGRNNPLRNIDPNGFKVLQATLAEAVSKINSLSGGTFYLDFAGIQGLHAHQSLGTWANFGLWHSDHTAANSVIIPNKGIVSGFFRGLFGVANKDQVDTGKAIMAACKDAGQDCAFDTYSNGVNAAGKVARGLSPGDLYSALVAGPNANSPAPVQAMDQADSDTTLIFVSGNDPALALALFGSQSVSDWESEFPGRVFDPGQASHNLNQYHKAESGNDEIQNEMQRQCALGNPAACN